MRRVLLATLVAAGLSLAKESGIVVADAKVWKNVIPFQDNVTLKVCWDPVGDLVKIEDPHEKADLGYHAVRYLKDEVESAVKQTWQKYAGIVFNFVEGHNATCDIRIYLQETSRSSAYAGRQPGLGYSPMYLNLTSLRYLSKDYPEELTSSFRAKLRAEWGTQRTLMETDGTLKSFLIRRARYIGVHEFGHAIGILHEHGRLEASTEIHTEVAQASSRPVAFYDPYSVMNYNSMSLDGSRVYRDRDGEVLPDMPKLSCGDLITSRFLYPPPSAKAALIPCCTESRYKYILQSQETHLRWSDFYANNLSCLEGGEIRRGQLATQTCVALAKQSGTADVCKTQGEGVSPTGETIRCGGQNCEKFHGEKPEFKSDVSMFWKNDMPWVRLKIQVPNLSGVHGQKIDPGMVEFRSASSRDWGQVPPGTLFSGQLDQAAGQNSVTIEMPRGRGAYNAEKGCFCSYTSVPPPNGSYAKYDGEKGLYLVDHTFTAIRYRYYIKDGMKLITYTNSARTQESSTVPPMYSGLYAFVDFSLTTGDDFSLGYVYNRWPNQAPGKPAITSLTATDNGAGIISVAWNPVSDPDGEPVYYFVDLQAENTSESQWKRHNAVSATSAQFTGLPRNTKYIVQITAFDSKDITLSDQREITTVNLPEACQSGNTSKVLLPNLPGTMVRKAINLYDYRIIPSGVTNTNIWNYSESFCVEHSPNGFALATIDIPADVERTDWLYIEAEDYVYARLRYGPEAQAGTQVTPGQDATNEWSYASGNLIRLSDWWGQNEWPMEKRLEKVQIVYKVNPTTRGTHRFGRLMLLKNGPFAISYSGLRVNEGIYTGSTIDHKSYAGEPVDLLLDTWAEHVGYTGSLVSSFSLEKGSKKQFRLATTPVMGVNTYTLNIQNTRYTIDNQTVTLRLEVVPAPGVTGLKEPNGNWAKVIAPGKTYGLEFSGLAKPIRKLKVEVNGYEVPLSFKDGLFTFICPSDLKGNNKIIVTLDGATLADFWIRRAGLLTGIISLLLN